MLFERYSLNGLSLSNRIVMPPMTRSRAGTGDVATDLMAEYYAQRASAGLNQRRYTNQPTGTRICLDARYL
ncbi:alkene reductase [Xenorhabdus vietnamensis]|uniref:Alkene reductase n=1 Tax=Xenorhabdus vietnamensis TaxID=351656 RepID=A0A1Y2S6S4_9GAMM|nr:alkene reductase [Xenorhabdus vietnamensis]